MSKQYILLSLVLSLFLNGFSQKNINDYKYLVVPTTFDFVDEKDKYRLNTLTRYLFKENGFTTFYNEEKLPEDLFENRCLALYADVKNIANSFTVKIQIELLDCEGNLVFVSDIGKTKIKNYAKGYPIAIREAFESIVFLNYKYKPSQAAQKASKKLISNTEALNRVESQKEKEAITEIKRLQEEVNSLKQKEKLKALAEKEGVLKKESAQKKGIIKDTDIAQKEDDTLLANPIKNGFQIMDANSTEFMVLLYSGSPDIYIVKGQDALVFKKENAWMYALNDGSGLTVKQINLKF
jgi:hypothetical protein